MLGAVLRDLLRPTKVETPSAPIRPRVLNVGGGSKSIAIPPHYDGWDHVLLDIDPRGNPDVVCDARMLESLKPAQFDAVYCSHNLEHYHKHEGAKVLRGFLHVLTAEGFAEIRVPDIQEVVGRAANVGMDLDDVLYASPSGPITVHDVIYGLGWQIESSGNDYYAHKTGFSPRLLRLALESAGFGTVYVTRGPTAFEVSAIAFKSAPTLAQCERLGLPPPGPPQGGDPKPE